MNPNKFTTAKDLLKQNERSFFEVAPPFTIEGDVFTSSTGHSFEFTKFGTDYLSHQIGGDRIQYREMLNVDGPKSALCNQINEDWSQTEGAPNSLVCASVNGQAVGFLKNYNPVQSELILEAIEEIGLTGAVVRSGFSLMEFVVYVSLENRGLGDAGIKIRNGHSGHISLNYQFYYSVQDYEFNFPMSAAARHLSTVGETLDHLTDAIEALGEIRYDELLLEAEARDVMRLLRSEFDEPSRNMAKILDKIEGSLDAAETKNAYDILIVVNEFLSRRGYKSPAQRIGDFVVQNIVTES